MIKGYEPLLDLVIEKLSSIIDMSSIACDHICYRVETEQRYQEIKTELTESSRLATESMVSERLISIFVLDKPLIYRGLSIDCIELPAPKITSYYKEGFEHVEFVIKDLDQFIAEHQNLDFNHKAMDRPINPELGLRLNDHFQVKFHPLHILEVIQLERDF